MAHLRIKPFPGGRLVSAAAARVCGSARAPVGVAMRRAVLALVMGVAGAGGAAAESRPVDPAIDDFVMCPGGYLPREVANAWMKRLRSQLGDDVQMVVVRLTAFGAPSREMRLAAAAQGQRLLMRAAEPWPAARRIRFEVTHGETAPSVEGTAGCAGASLRVRTYGAK